MIIKNTPNYTKSPQVIFIRVIRPMPSGDVERGVLLGTREQFPSKLREDRPGRRFATCHPSKHSAFEMSNRDLEIASISQGAGSNGSQFRQLEMSLIQLADIPSRRAIRKQNTIADSSGNNGNLILSDEEVTELGLDIERPGLWDDEVVPV